MAIWLAGCLFAVSTFAGDLTQWIKQTPVPPDPSKVVVPAGYKVGILVSGLSTPSSAAVDGDGNIWVAISGQSVRRTRCRSDAEAPRGGL